MLLDPSTDYMPGQYTVSDLRRLKQGDGYKQGPLGLHSESEPSLGYIRIPCYKTNKQLS